MTDSNPTLPQQKTCAEEFVRAGIRIADEWLKRGICMTVAVPRSDADLGQLPHYGLRYGVARLPGISNDLDVVRLLQVL